VRAAKLLNERQLILIGSNIHGPRDSHGRLRAESDACAGLRAIWRRTMVAFRARGRLDSRAANDARRRPRSAISATGRRSDSRRTDGAIDRSAIGDGRNVCTMPERHPCGTAAHQTRRALPHAGADLLRDRRVSRLLGIGPTLALPTQCEPPLRRATRRISRCRRARISMQMTSASTLHPRAGKLLELRRH
jgi:hypothetical protein